MTKGDMLAVSVVTVALLGLGRLALATDQPLSGMVVVFAAGLYFGHACWCDSCWRR